MKKRFYVYNSWREQMELLSVEEKATMLMNLFAYQNDEEVVLDTPMLKMCWTSMKFLLEKDANTYQQKVDNMKKIGKRNNKTSNDIVTINNDTVTTTNDTIQSRLDNDNDNDNVNVNVNEDGNGNGNGDDSWEMLQMMKWDEMKGNNRSEDIELFEYETKMGVI